MMKRSLLLIVSLWGVLLVTSGGTQTQGALSEPLDATTWLPADVDAALVVPMGDPDDSARTLNILLFFATLLQPERIQFTARLPLDDLFPLDMLDVEGDIWADHIAPWVRGAMVIGYGVGQNARGEPVYLLPTGDAFATTSSLSPLLRAQDFLERDSYQGVRVYHGDRAALAVAPEALILGSADAVRAVLDVRAGDAPGLDRNERFEAVRAGTAASLPDADIFAFLQGTSAARALPLLFGSGPEADGVLNAIAQTVVGFTGQTDPTTALLSGGVDAVGVRLRPDTALVRELRASVMIHLRDSMIEANAPADTSDTSDLLTYVPRSAFIVSQGRAADVALGGAFAALPAANFAPVVLAGFPVGQTGGTRGLLPPPDADVMQSAAIGMAEALRDAGISLTEVLSAFPGPYAAALLARPNDPTPVLNNRVDVLFVAPVTDGPDVIAALTEALDLIIGEPLFNEEMVNGVTAHTAAVDGEPVVRLALDGDVLLVGTGQAVDQALRARDGDNRLIAQPRWEQISGPLGLERQPNLFLDLAAFYAVFQPGEGGGLPIAYATLGAAARAAGDGYYLLDVVMQLEQRVR